MAGGLKATARELDGIAREAYLSESGYQDQLDAATIYGLLENEIAPLYFNKNQDGYSEDWVKVVKNSIATIAPHYT